MKRAALVIYSDTDFGGAERRLIRIYNELGKTSECDLIVRGCKSLEVFRKRLEKADCDVKNIHTIRCFGDNIHCLLYLLTHKRYDTVHYVDICGFHQVLASLYMKTKTKTIFTVAFQNYAYGLTDDETKRKLIKLLDTSKQVDVLFPAGEKYFKEISTNKNITVTPGTFTDIDLFVPEKKEKIILFAAARLEKDKNAELLVEACNICQDELRKSGYTVMICGKGFEEEKLRNLVKKYKIEDIVNMPGYVRISEVMPKTEIFLCIDLIDNYPSQTIAEAVSCGCALICTDVGYSRKCASEDFSLFIPNTAKALAEGMLTFIQKTQEEKDTIVKNARAYAKRTYCIDVSVDYFGRLL